MLPRLLTRLLLASLALAPALRADDLPHDAAILDADLVWDVANPEAYALSRDGRQMAYTSRGAIWLCDVDAGPPRKLADLPNTTTDILTWPEYGAEREKSARSPQDRRFTPLTGPKHSFRDFAFSLAWTPAQDGLVYVVRKHIGNETRVAKYHVMHASLAGAIDEVVAIEGPFGNRYEDGLSFYVTPDRKFVVISSYRPLIWDVTRNRPQVTPYDLLVPSTASGRYLGVEIDSRELVLVDEQFAISKRYGVFFPVDRPIDLTWSGDERFAICRTHNEYGSQGATAFRISLEALAQSPTVRCNIKDRFLFIGAEGRFLHLRVNNAGVWGYLNGEAGTRVTLVEPDGESRNLFTTSGFRKPERGQLGSIFPPMIAASDGSRIAYALPRPADQLPGAQYHLIDLAGDSIPLPPVSDDRYITPYLPITFADANRRLIARSGATLFSVPVPTAASSDEANESAKEEAIDEQ
ncbi:hypothetical protein [Lacipirellula sp.]|uniref:hypothetical protein n=1 Tax=Lacipirellula sp. TaxID=2691419 RepID=UPI003D123FEA